MFPLIGYSLFKSPLERFLYVIMPGIKDTANQFSSGHGCNFNFISEKTSEQVVNSLSHVNVTGPSAIHGETTDINRPITDINSSMMEVDEREAKVLEEFKDVREGNTSKQFASLQPRYVYT